MTETRTTYEQFTDRASDFGASVTRVPPDEVAETITARSEAPVVGAPLPWDDVSLPAAVPTDPTPAALDAATTGVSAAALGIADYGSVVLRATPGGSEPVSLFPDRHVAVVREDAIVPDMPAAFDWFGERFREARESAIIATGPSATADMGELVRGAHGPKAVEIVVVQ
jgi:L-lactate dehydrogenase complex protein LldG